MKHSVTNTTTWPFRRVTIVLVICIVGYGVIAPFGEWAARGYLGLIVILGTVMPVTGARRGAGPRASADSSLPGVGTGRRRRVDGDEDPSTGGRR